MSEAFDINDRRTWAWTYTTVDEASGADGDFGLDPQRDDAFFEIVDGSPRRQSCPPEMKYNPMLNVCEPLPVGFTEAEVYDWAIANGAVTDQR